MNVRECYVVLFQDRPIFRTFDIEKATSKADTLNNSARAKNPGRSFNPCRMTVEYVVELKSRHGETFYGRVDLVSIDE